MIRREVHVEGGGCGGDVTKNLFQPAMICNAAGPNQASRFGEKGVDQTNQGSTSTRGPEPLTLAERYLDQSQSVAGRKRLKQNGCFETLRGLRAGRWPRRGYDDDDDDEDDGAHAVNINLHWP